MKILIIAPQPFFSPRGTPLSVYSRTLITRKLGHDLDFLTYGQGQDVDIEGVNFFRIPPLFSLGKIKVGPSVLKLLHDFFLFFALLRLLLSNKYDVVHAHEEAVFMATFLKRIFHYKLLYDMHSSLPQQMSNFNFTSSKLIINTFAWLENRSLSASEAIITICPDLYNYVNKVLPGNNCNYLIENSLLEPVRLKSTTATAEDSSADLSIMERFDKVVVYAGTLEAYQGLDILVDAIPHVIEANNRIGFIIVGGNPRQVAELSARAEKAGAGENVIFTGQLPQQAAKQFNQAASVLVSPRSSGTNTPLKIYEQLASGIPLVATDIYSHSQVLSDDVAFLVKPDAESMATGIIEALGEKGPEKAANAKALYEREYSKPVYIAKLTRVLENLA